MMHKAWSSIGKVPYCLQGHPLNFKIARDRKLSILTRIECFRTVTLYWIHSWMALKWCTKLNIVKKRCSIVFQGHPWNSKVTRLKKSSILTQIGRFQTVTPVWIHQWVRNDAQSLKKDRGGALMFLKDISQISRSHGRRNADFDLNLGLPDCNSSLNSPMALKWCTQLNVV